MISDASVEKDEVSSTAVSKEYNVFYFAMSESCRGCRYLTEVNES